MKKVHRREWNYENREVRILSLNGRVTKGKIGVEIIEKKKGM